MGIVVRVIVGSVQISTISVSVLPGQVSHLRVDSNNTPMIAYTDAHEDLAPLGLKIAEPAYGQPYANCSGEILYDWYCANLDNGNAYVDDARFVSLGIKSSGLAMIAYSEQERDYPGSYDLKLAYQLSWTFLPLTRNKLRYPLIPGGCVRPEAIRQN